MFSIVVEEVFQISNRRGITLIGETSGVIKIGEYLYEECDKIKSYKVIGLEMVRFSDYQKCITHNPAILIECGDFEPSELKGKTLKT